MKRIFTLLLSLCFLSSGKIFSQDCVVLGCAAAQTNVVANVGALTDQALPFVNGCFPLGSTYRQIVWQFFVSNGGNYKQLFTPTNGGDPLNINWVMFDMNNTPPSTNATCADVSANVAGWTAIACGSISSPGTPQGPGDASLPNGVGTNAGSHYAIAVVITQGAQASYSFDIGAPTLDVGAGDEPFIPAANCDIGSSEDCVTLGCAAAHTNQVANVGPLTDQPVPFTAGCFPLPSTYRQIVWQFFVSNGGNYKQLFTPTNGGDPLNINWVMFDMNNTPPSTNATCADVAANVAGWTAIACGSNLSPGTPQGPGDASIPNGVGTNAGSHYAIAVVINQSAQPSYSFDIGAPTLDVGAGDEPLTVANCDIVLPVKLSSFGARVSNCATSLNWTSEIETGFKNYEVEYSSSGTNFKTIATIPAGDITGAPQKYSYTDPTPRQGNVYYRLKMVDVDGKFDYSKIVVMKISCNQSQLTVYPNPVIDILNVNITTPQDETTTGKLFDSEGRLVYSHTLVSGTNTINMRNLPGGIYHLQLISNSQVQHIKVIK